MRILDAVRRETSEDPVARRDAALVEKVLALPHDLVCEKGRAALDDAPPTDGRHDAHSARTEVDRSQEVP